MTANELSHATHAIKQAICECMPTAAVASGWMSAVDVTPWVNEVSERFPFAVRPTFLGLTPLRKWLAEQGVECGERHAKALRERWLRDLMRHEVAAGK